ncbi:MAG: BREX-1 system phosphatase PglZ type B [Solirubrobacteraceae bacterium]|nr:BREX-1 system phosphatase PglZ type B [Solirubrobacteraceae bacterium]
MSETVLDAIGASLSSALSYAQNVRVAPVALLWPDEAAQWRSIIGRLQEKLPVISLGEYDVAARSGPAYWIRCVVARSVDVGLPTGAPIVYLPGVSRSQLRAADACPPELAPIAELQYRSQWFSHPNNRDWTVRALMSNPERGLGLRIADDADTGKALLLALDRIVDERVDRLRRQQIIDADYCLELVSEDPVRSVLRWLDDPNGFRLRTEDAQWTAFVAQCKAEFAFDPMVDGEVSAARKLGLRESGWSIVWRRFAETPERYPGVAEQLRKARPEALIVDNRDAWPQENEDDEDQLRSRLRDFTVLTPEGARKEVRALDREHAWRRGTVWADLDQAQLAFALEQLVALAEVTEQPLASADLESIVTDYGDRGWRADDAVLRALAAARTASDREAVSAAAAAMYRHWVDEGAKALQQVIGPMADAHSYQAGSPAPKAPGSITLFVDGLRLDVARRVEDRLTYAGLNVDSVTSLSALPTVTQTAKPALVPTASGALGPGPDLHPANTATGTKASIQVLRALMGENGVQVLGTTEVGDPSGTAWGEVGELDHRGHDMGIRLVDHLDEDVDRIVGRIRELIEAGWERVQVMTDHGWMLLPGGMEKVELPPATSEVKKGRCARLKDGAVVDVPTVPWYWDADVRIALAPGATCFEANKEYEHGGVSPQECVVPRIAVTAGVTAAVGAPEITKVKWLGLQCRVEYSGVTDKVVVDLRGLPAEPSSSIAEQAKETSSAGKVSLLVPDEEHEGERAHLVMVAIDGQILAQREVVVGRNR